MAKRCFVYDWMQLQPQVTGDLTMWCTALYWEETGSELIFSSDPTTFPVTISTSMTANQITSEVATQAKAKALELFGWTMANNTVISPTFNRS